MDRYKIRGQGKFIISDIAESEQDTMCVMRAEGERELLGSVGRTHNNIWPQTRQRDIRRERERYGKRNTGKCISYKRS